MLKKSSSVDSNASNASTGENAAIDLHGEKMLVTLGQPRQLDTKYKRGMKNERERTEPPTPVPMPGIGDEVATMVSCGDTCLPPAWPSPLAARLSGDGVCSDAGDFGDLGM